MVGRGAEAEKGVRGPSLDGARGDKQVRDSLEGCRARRKEKSFVESSKAGGGTVGVFLRFVRFSNVHGTGGKGGH